MSSEPEQRPLWRSSALRGALLAALFAWFLVVVALLSVINTAQITLFAETVDQLQDEVDELLEAAAADTPPEALLELTPEADWDRLSEDDAERLEDGLAVLRARDSSLANAKSLFLLAEDEDPEAFIEDFAEQLNAESTLTAEPSPAVDLLDLNTLSAFQPTIAFRQAFLSAFVEWPEQAPFARLVRTLQLADRSDNWHEERCFLLRAGSVEGQPATPSIKNYDRAYATDIAQERWRVYAVQPTSRQQLAADTKGQDTFCVTLRVALSDGAVLHYGAINNETSRAVRAMQDSAGAIIVFAAISLLILAIAIAARRLARINSLALNIQQDAPTTVAPKARFFGSDDAWLRGLLKTKLRVLEQRIGNVRELSDGLAHDMRTPLTRLRNRIEFIGQDGTVAGPHLDQLSRDADQLLETFNALLRIAELEQGAGRREFRPFNLATSLLEITELYEPAFADQQIALNLALASRDVTVRGDRGVWMQALANVLDNALTYAADSATINIDLQNAEQPTVTIVDAGPGVPAPQLERLTERFYRADGARTSNGTGLGLALVAAICKLHGIELRISNVSGSAPTGKLESSSGSTGLKIEFIWPAPDA